MTIDLPAIIHPSTRDSDDAREKAQSYLRTYYGRRIAGGDGGFTGAWFDQLFTDPKSPADEFTAEDLLAPALLSVPVRGTVVREILYLNPQKYSQHLSQLDPDRDFFSGESVEEGLQAALALDAELQ